MKKTGKILAIAAACACVAGVAGCATSVNRLSVDSYWYIDSYEGIQSTSIDPEENGRTAEVLLYNISFDEQSGGNGSYRVNYFTDSEDFAGGETPHYYKTKFYATGFDWNDSRVAEAYRMNEEAVGKLPEGDKARFDGTSEIVYVLETELKISGEYIFGKDEATEANSVEFSDYMNTVSYFRSARNGLVPVYSRQEVHTTSPNGMVAGSVDTMCKDIEYVYEVSYNFECTEATYTYTEKGENGQFGEPVTRTAKKLENSSYTLFDNNTLYQVMRGMSFSNNFSATISLFSAADLGTVNVSLAGGTTNELDKEKDKDIISALTTAYGEPEKPENADEDEDSADHSYIYYNPVSIKNANGKGVTRTAWFASVTDEDDNTYRATMLYLNQPLSYGLGTWEFRLAEVVSVLGELA